MSEQLNLRKFVAPEIIFGSGARLMVGQYARQFAAQKVLVVTDSGVTSAGWLSDVTRSLQEAEVPYHIFSNVSPNPRSFEVMEGAEIYREQGCNVIVAVGGGSPMDCAKGIGIVTSNNMDILTFEGVDKICVPAPPLIFIPTTAGSSADVSQFCIISNRDELVKIAIVSKSVVPDVALIDPETTATMDPYLTACTGVDALVHSIEAFVSSGSGVLTDSYAIEAIKTVSQSLPLLLDNPKDMVLREQLMLGSMQAGLAFSNAILGAVHAMAHSLGGYLDLAHGECNAMLLEHVINFNFKAAPERFRVIGEAMGIDTKELKGEDLRRSLIGRIADLKKNVGIINTLGRLGVNKSDVSELSRKALNDACLITNPRKAKQRDIEVIFEEAL